MKLQQVLWLSLALIGRCHGDDNEGSLFTEGKVSSILADMWVEGGDILRILWRDCSKKIFELKDEVDPKDYYPKFVRCMKRKTLKALDRSLSTDIVPLADGVNLVRYELIDRAGKIMDNPENVTSFWTEKELDEGDWKKLAFQRMARVLRTHVIKLDLDGKDTPEKAEFRHRRRQQMMTMMIFGVVSMLMVVVPMGFQFLAVLGGKALLLAKMALILSSVQGLKKVDDWNRMMELHKGKVATSPLNYGFYQSYPPYEHYERRGYDVGDWSRQGFIGGTPPPALPRQGHWPSDARTDVKFDRTLPADTEAYPWKPEVPHDIKQSSNAEPRLFPVYLEQPSAASVISTLDAPPMPYESPPTTPADVHAEYSVDLPINRIYFQSPSDVVST